MVAAVSDVTRTPDEASRPPRSGEPTEPAEPGKKLRFPTAFTVLALILLAVWIASFFVTAGAYDSDKDGAPVPGTYHKLPNCSSAPEGAKCVDTSFSFRFKQLWDAPPNGLYGVEGESGQVGADEAGFLYGSAPIFLFVLAVGAFITVTMKTGAIQTGIGRLAMRFRRTGTVLIAILMVVFALGGTTYGMWEETLGFFVLLVPLALALGFDRVVAASIIFLGAGTGVIASTVNPFATGVASDAAGISIGDGIGLRVLMWFVLVTIAIGYVLLYARRVKEHPEKSVVGISKADGEESREPRDGRPGADRAPEARPGLVRRRVRGDDLRLHPLERPVAGGVGPRLPVADVRELLLRRGRGAVPGHGRRDRIDREARRGGDGQHDRVRRGRVPRRGADHRARARDHGRHEERLHHRHDPPLDGEGGVGASSGAFAILAFVVNLPIAFLVPSSSGHAALVMPIIAPLADFADVPRAIAVTAYQSASGLVNLVTPTSAVIMGGLALSKVGYDRYLKFVWPYLAIVFVVCCAFLGIAAAIS